MREPMHSRALFRLAVLLTLALLSVCRAGRAQSQQENPPAPIPSRAAVQISFLPPPLDAATYSLGIFEAKSGRLIRRLHEIAPESAFAVGVNGLITKWDGKNDKGEPAPPGRYAARGYAVGALKVEGIDILGNDWTRADGDLRIRRIESIGLSASGDHLVVYAGLGDHSEVLEFDGNDGKLLSEKALHLGEEALERPKKAPGKDGSSWQITQDSELIQEASDGTVLRQLSRVAGEPAPVAVAASTTADCLYLLEEMPGWQRVRGLSWVATKEEDGKQVSTWQTFFERDIRAPDPALGLAAPAVPLEISLVENPLEPGKPQKVKLSAGFDQKGSYLTTAEGLRLRRISQRADIAKVRLMKGKAAGSLAFFEYDGAAWDEFSIEGARNMMSFDAGEFELTAAGEKPLTEKAPEPPDP